MAGVKVRRARKAAEPGSEEVKVFVKFPPGKSAPLVVRQLAQALADEFKKDKTWFDQALINADGVTRVWVVKNMPGDVKRIVSAEVHALKTWNAADVVRRMREELRKLVEGGSLNG